MGNPLRAGLGKNCPVGVVALEILCDTPSWGRSSVGRPFFASAAENAVFYVIYTDFTKKPVTFWGL